MLTPCFDVTQDDGFVIIAIRVPFAKASEAEFFIDGNSFKFYCKPYFLRLCLPGELVEDGRERAVHDIEKGTITVYVPKRNAGHHFDNLGMITSLLSKKPATKVAGKPIIEVLPDDSSKDAAVGDVVEEEEEFDWQVDQLVPVDEDEELQLDKYSSFYGFADQQKGVFSKLQHEIPAIVDCPDPDHMTWRERRLARLAHEEASFKPEHYLADLMEGTEMVECLCQFLPAWSQQLMAWRTKKPSETKEKSLKEPNQDIIPFSDAEKVQLKELPNKEYLLDKATERALYLGLVDIIFAYAYDHRITEGEHNVESAWTICKLTSTLSWLEVFRGSVEEVVYCSVRRSLCYPLYRHWQLVQCVLQDITQLFQLGRRKLLQCLLAVRSILNSAEPYYIMNTLYITDYCVWIQKASIKQVQNLALELKQVHVERSSIGWELEELEQAAHLVAAEGSTEHDEDTEQDTEHNEDDTEQDREDDTKQGSMYSSEGDTETGSAEDGSIENSSSSDSRTRCTRKVQCTRKVAGCEKLSTADEHLVSVATRNTVAGKSTTTSASECSTSDVTPEDFSCATYKDAITEHTEAVVENKEDTAFTTHHEIPKASSSGGTSSTSGALHPDSRCDDGVEDLTEALLTLQLHSQPTCTEAQTLIRELN